MQDEDYVDELDKLRERAENSLQKPGFFSSSAGLSLDQMQGALHELQVHQVELELQNEELRRTQEELELARERYFDLYDLAPVGYFTMNQQGRIHEGNLTAASLLGVERSALPKQYITKFIMADDSDTFYRHLRTLVEQGTRQTSELRMLRSDSKPIWVRMRATIHGEAEQALVRLVISDIGEQKRLEKSLSESERRYRTLFENAPLGFFSTTPAGDVFDANHALAEMFGYESAEIMVADAPNILSELRYASEKRVSANSKMMQNRGVSLERNCYHRRDGGKFCANVNVKAIMDGSSRILYYEGIMEEVSERTMMEKASDAFLHTTDAIMVVSLKGIITAWNPAAERLYGWSRAEAVGMNLSKLLLPSGYPEEMERLQVRAREGSGAQTAVRMMRNGNKLELWQFVSPVLNKAGALDAFQATERVKSE